MMNIQLLKQYLKKNIDVYYFDSIDSTMKYAREVLNKVDDDTLIIANHQTNAVGRYDRRFECFKDYGLYFSLIIKDNNLYSTDNLTMICAVALKEAIKTLLGIDLKIKWINDMFLNNKKVSGILINKINNDYIIGIGINLIKNNQLLDTATSLLEEESIIAREKILAEIVNNIYYYLENNDNVHQKYIEYSLVYKEYVLLVENDENLKVFVDDILKDGTLNIIDQENKTRNVSSGDVRIIVGDK